MLPAEETRTVKGSKIYEVSQALLRDLLSEDGLKKIHGVILLYICDQDGIKKRTNGTVGFKPFHAYEVSDTMLKLEVSFPVDDEILYMRLPNDYSEFLIGGWTYGTGKFLDTERGGYLANLKTLSFKDIESQLDGQSNVVIKAQAHCPHTLDTYAESCHVDIEVVRKRAKRLISKISLYLPKAWLKQFLDYHVALKNTAQAFCVQ